MFFFWGGGGYIIGQCCEAVIFHCFCFSIKTLGEFVMVRQSMTEQWNRHKSSVALVLAGHVSQASICWLSADPHLPIGIQCLSQHSYPVLFTSFITCSGANYPPPSPAPPFVTVKTFLSDIPCFLKQTPFILNHVVTLKCH